MASVHLGNDDFGLERDFQSKKEAEEVFDIISNTDIISQDFLLQEMKFRKHNEISYNRKSNF